MKSNTAGLLFLLLIFVSSECVAGDFGIVINGRSHHFDRDLDRNESNYGLGVEYELNGKERWVRFAVANTFVDSMDNLSYMAGFGLKRRMRFGESRTWYMDAGVVAFIMTREEYHGHRPFPGALPTLTLGRKRAALNLVYIPGFEPITEEALFLQLKLNLTI